MIVAMLKILSVRKLLLDGNIRPAPNCKCGRDGCYGLNRLIERRGRNAKLVDWLDELTARLSEEASPQYER